MRFGIRLGPFWVSTSSRRSRRRSATHGFHGITRDEHGKEHSCPHNHRTREAAQQCALREQRKLDEAAAAARAARIRSMSVEEYRRAAEADPVYRDWLARRQQQTEDKLQRLKDEQQRVDEALKGGAFKCEACGGRGYETAFLAEIDGPDWHVRCTSCGALHTARLE